MKTNLIEAAKAALEALDGAYKKDLHDNELLTKVVDANIALRAAIEEAEKVKPEIAEEKLAAVKKERDELLAALKELMKYNSRTKRIGGIENGYHVLSGEALCKVLDVCEAAIAKIGKGEEYKP